MSPRSGSGREGEEGEGLKACLCCFCSRLLEEYSLCSARTAVPRRAEVGLSRFLAASSPLAAVAVGKRFVLGVSFWQLLASRLSSPCSGENERIVQARGASRSKAIETVSARSAEPYLGGARSLSSLSLSTTRLLLLLAQLYHMAPPPGSALATRAIHQDSDLSTAEVAASLSLSTTFRHPDPELDGIQPGYDDEWDPSRPSRDVYSRCAPPLLLLLLLPPRPDLS